MFYMFKFIFILTNGHSGSNVFKVRNKSTHVKGLQAKNKAYTVIYDMI